MFERLKSFIGAVKLVKSDAKTQTVQVALTKEFVIDNVPHIEPYGFTAHPQADAECLVVNVGENGERPVAVVIGGRTCRLQGLQAGEVALYTDEGDEIRLKRGHEIVVKTSKFVIDAAEIDLNGAVKVAQTLEVAGNITGKGEVADKTGNLTVIRSTYDAHTHTGNAGAPTSPPDATMGG